MVTDFLGEGADAVLKNAKLIGALGLGRKVEEAGNAAENTVNQTRKYWTKTVEYDGKKVYQRDDIIDPTKIDKEKRNNIQRMDQGDAPLGSDGKSIEVHHLTQMDESAVAEIPYTLHKKNYDVLHINPRKSKIPSGIDRQKFNKWKKSYWKNRANDFK